MVSIIPRREQWASANQAYLEALSQDTDLLLAATDDFVALNITAKKSALKDSVAHAKLLLDVKDVRELITLRRQSSYPGFEKTVAYGCVFYDLMAQLQAQAWRLAEIRFSDLVEPLTKSTNSADSGSNADSDVARSFMGLAQFSLDAMKSSGKQLAAMTERNVAAMTIASVQISNTAKNAVEVFLPEQP
ncbi:MAG: phasin family protein [Betaproteobacteria bacterium]|nr:phasin family protein [Betaproteobacteria bacterium]